VLDTATGGVESGPALPLGVIAGLAERDGRLAFALTGPQHNFDVWSWLPGEQAIRATRSFAGGLARESLVAPQLVRYPSFDGRRIPAWWYRPAMEGRAPVVIDIHGGPESQRRAAFDGLFQYYLARGYGVLAPNVRGSTGYGREYESLDNLERRMDSVADVNAAVTWLERVGGADPRRIVVQGGSYGGFMVLACLATYPERFAAGIDIVGIANFVTFLENTGPWRRAIREAEYGSLERDRALLERISPIHQVDRIQAPLFVIHGANDPRVPVGEAEQIVESLRARGRPVEYLRFADEGHGIAKHANRVRAYAAVVDWLDRVLA
jgi:dipeptidyl aminopeptidase/acylaminoacyl peptidase